jgi:hypothetical protein
MVMLRKAVKESILATKTISTPLWKHASWQKSRVSFYKTSYNLFLRLDGKNVRYRNFVASLGWNVSYKILKVLREKKKIFFCCCCLYRFWTRLLNDNWLRDIFEKVLSSRITRHSQRVFQLDMMSLDMSTSKPSKEPSLLRLTSLSSSISWPTPTPKFCSQSVLMLKV